MQLRTAERKRAKIKMALQGPSGSGKTYSSLLLAYGLCNNWERIVVIDSENQSANLYAHLGKYKVLDIQAPFTPEKYIEAIEACEKAFMEVIIIDSLSHPWEGIGGLLDTLNNMTGNSYTNWNKLTPRQNSFMQHILQSPTHLIATIRSKQDYVLTEKNGKMVPEKVGLKGIQREGIEYDFTLVFELDMKNNASSSKDRTSIFINKPEFKITPTTGEMILEWCNQQIPIDDFDSNIVQLINQCKTIEELLKLYKENPSIQNSMLSQFTRKRQLLTVKDDLKTIINKQNITTNGTTNNK